MFAVIWMNLALDELADAMVKSDLSTQDLIERQILELNAQLASDPFAIGESRIGNYRVVFSDPVAILYYVSKADGIVRVVNSWTY